MRRRAATFSFTWRYQDHLISEGQGTAAHNIPIPANNTTSGEVTIHENGGIFNAALRPTQNWDINGSVEVIYNDNAFTPMGFRQSPALPGAYHLPAKDLGDGLRRIQRPGAA